MANSTLASIHKISPQSLEPGLLELNTQVTAYSLELGVYSLW